MKCSICGTKLVGRFCHICGARNENFMLVNPTLLDKFTAEKIVKLTDTKIEAIKLFKAIHNCGLFEAKQAIDVVLPPPSSNNNKYYQITGLEATSYKTGGSKEMRLLKK